MEIEILHLIDGAKRACGITVIIDVFRAYSVQCYAFGAGIKRIYPVADLDVAYKIKSEHKDFLLCGEREGKKQEGCDFGNSPFEILKSDVQGRTLIHTTSAGTQGIENAMNADVILGGALCNAATTAKYILSQNPAHVSLVCMGLACRRKTAEDTLCAEYIKALLTGEDFDKTEAVATMRALDGSRFFVEADQGFAPSEDFYLCTEFDKFDFILPVKKDENGTNFIEKQFI